MTNFGASIEKAWKYSTNLKRLGVFMLFLIIAMAIVIAPMIFIYGNVALSTLNVFSFLQLFAWLIVGIVIALLIYMYSVLLFTHNYANQKSLKKSSAFAKSRYLRFLGVVIVTGIITGIVSAVPFIGVILAIIAGLAFFFVHQEVAVSDNSISKALTNSYNIFKKNVVDVIITFIITTILAIVIMLIFAIPLFIVGLTSAISALRGGGFMHVLMSNAPLFVVTGLILLFGVALAILFTNSIRTDVYMQLKKRK